MLLRLTGTRRQKPGVIYFLQSQCANGFIKVGFTQNLPERQQGLTYACPYDLNLLSSPKGYLWQELAFHELLQGSLHRGEWFRPTEEVLDLARSSLDRDLTDLANWRKFLEEVAPKKLAWRRLFDALTRPQEAAGG